MGKLMSVYDLVISLAPVPLCFVFMLVALLYVEKHPDKFE